MTAGLVSIIVPMLNEEGNIAPLFERLRGVARLLADKHGLSTEVIVNDNCSTDRTLDELRAYAATHDVSQFALRIFRFSRNIGFQKSILVGYRKARGDAVAQIDADLQDPPELLVDFASKWREGYHVVYGVRRMREESAVMNGLRKLFYRMIDKMSADDLPKDAGDFRMLDRSVVDVICALHDNDPYLRGAIASLGLRQIGVPYDRTSRVRGKSKFGFRQLIKLAIDGITNHTTLPLRFASYLALVVVMLASTLIAYYLYGYFTSTSPIPLGFMTQSLLQLGTLGALSLLFAIQGFYIQRIYNQLKERPLAIIEHQISQPQDDGSRQTPPGTLEVLWIGRPDDNHARLSGGDEARPKSDLDHSDRL